MLRIPVDLGLCGAVIAPDVDLNAISIWAWLIQLNFVVLGWWRHFDWVAATPAVNLHFNYRLPFALFSWGTRLTG